jgi:protein-S-isoprenylcysteine O-methyltransferase Ste14
MVIVGLAFRIPQEEKMLIGEFGEEYRAYVRRTGGLFPRSIRLI